MEENYYALLIAIVCNLSPEDAFEKLDTGRVKRKFNLLMEEAEDMAKLRASDGLTYRAIGEMFGVSPSTAYRRIERLPEKLKRKEGKKNGNKDNY